MNFGLSVCLGDGEGDIQAEKKACAEAPEWGVTRMFEELEEGRWVSQLKANGCWE